MKATPKDGGFASKEDPRNHDSSSQHFDAFRKSALSAQLSYGRFWFYAITVFFIALALVCPLVGLADVFSAIAIAGMGLITWSLTFDYVVNRGDVEKLLVVFLLGLNFCCSFWFGKMALTSEPALIHLQYAASLTVPALGSSLDIRQSTFSVFLFLHYSSWMLATYTMIPKTSVEIASMWVVSIGGAVWVSITRHLRWVGLMRAYSECCDKESAQTQQKFFLSYIMHETRNPLSGMSLLLSELKAMVMEDVRAKLQDIRRAVANGPAVSLTSGLSSKGSDRVTLPEFPPVTHAQMFDSSSPSSTQADGWRDEVVSELQDLSDVLGDMESLIDRVAASAEVVKTVCDDVLTLEKMQRRQFNFSLNPFDPRELCTLFLESEAAKVRARGIDLSIVMEIDPDIEDKLDSKTSAGTAGFEVIGDGCHLRQVPINFLSNAGKFTSPGGSVSCTLKLQKVDPEHLPRFCVVAPPPEKEKSLEGLGLLQEISGAVTHQGNDMPQQQMQEKIPILASEDLPTADSVDCWVFMEVEVTDSGAGLSQEDIAKLFRPYSQIRAGELQRGGGTGLGLCICKSFVEGHWGGKVGARSDGRGCGSTFFFSLYLPLVRKARPFTPLHAPRRMSMSQRRNSLCSTSSLVKSPTKNSTVYLKKLPSSLSSRDSFHVSGEEKSASPAVTSRSSFNETPSRRITFADPPSPLMKPFLSPPSAKRSSLLSKDTTRSHPNSPLRTSGSPSISSTAPPRLLVVDDNDMCVMGAKLAAKRLRVPCVTASDGVSAVETFRKHAESVRLILMDRYMPHMEGPQAITHIRDYCKSRDPPLEPPKFVGLTGETSEEGRQPFIAAGAIEVLVKPLDSKDLCNLLTSLKLQEEETPAEGRREKTGREKVKEKKQIPAAIPVPSSESESKTVSKEEEKNEPESTIQTDTPPSTKPSISSVIDVSAHRRALRSCTEAAISPNHQSVPGQTDKDNDRSFSSPSAPRLMVVDDNELCVMGALFAAKRLGVPVLSAKCGSSAVDSFKQHAESIRLILMDRHMPNMEGPEAIVRILDHCRYSLPPLPPPTVIGVTGEASEDGRQAFLKAGASRVLIKPVDAKALTALLTEYRLNDIQGDTQTQRTTRPQEI
uniref:histidine kinase n=1 Tax=Chromera velia CCMP2878 TaxID=1169474 RepID=A0A0G4HPT0_9ALVE|eukprot:Cvel_7804.t1-p1 / transcript=Cvel_7804.t1 / gene=Cvel_7804 / organism=Chromera_velia_CCMP2878 / gene_product=Aerobic respiration control sensor protein ArcB, putative / transcript_product=Aerobic respiration control sensor protein ArcB, putative / location=Cvel_scaffold416:65092-70616(-) / protein_length=1115 / sequence_SO=supercontig / SO=protein_coding / is_pseudo=false